MVQLKRDPAASSGNDGMGAVATIVELPLASFETWFDKQ